MLKRSFLKHGSEKKCELKISKMKNESFGVNPGVYFQSAYTTLDLPETPRKQTTPVIIESVNPKNFANLEEDIRALEKIFQTKVAPPEMGSLMEELMFP